MATRKIALEEAITTPSTAACLDITLTVAPTDEAATALTQKLEDSDQRIAAMEAAEWIESTPVLTDQAQRDKVCYKNAERVLRLGFFHLG